MTHTPSQMPELKPCPFCKGVAALQLTDEEGNHRDDEYLNDPWSGIGYKIVHNEDENKDCPIAGHGEDGGTIGIFIYDDAESAAAAWNTRAASVPSDKEREK